MQTARTEDSPVYSIKRTAPKADDDTIRAALAILSARMRQPGPAFDSPATVKAFCCLTLGSLEHEEFAVLFLDAQHRLIEWRRMFSGTLTQTSVYPREVVKLALSVNAGAVVLCHNHPSGHTEPSRADEHLTQALKAALALVDVRVLDHLVVSGADSCSMAERGLI